MPREAEKSPRAMETALSSIWYTSGETTFTDRYWAGRTRPFFSLEMVSVGGEVHFYIWCFREFQAFVETNLYAQYPELEIHEVEDYASKFVYDPKTMDIFGNHMIYLERRTLPIRT